MFGNAETNNPDPEIYLPTIHQRLVLLTLHFPEFGLLSAQDPLPAKRSPSFICTVTDEPRSVSPFWFSLPTQCPANQPILFCLFEPSQISSPTDEMQTPTALVGSSKAREGDLYRLHQNRLLTEPPPPPLCAEYLFSCCMY